VLSQIERVAHYPLRAVGYRSRFVQTSVGRMHALSVEGEGDAPPLVLLHGYTSAAIHYVPLMRRLRPLVQRLVALDLPAHGFSDDPHAPLDGRALRNGLLEALDALLDRPAVLFGNSMGGLAAIHYGLQRATHVEGLVLCSPAGAAMDQHELDRFREAFRITTHAEALSFTDRLLPPGNMLRHAVAWGIRQKFTRPAMRALLDSLRPSDLLRPDELSALAPPTLFLWGKADHILPRGHRDFFHRHRAAHARFEEPEGFSHSPYLENAAALTERLERFFHELRQPAAVALATAG
jgi:pimeloyl-ACP methyl ester carboxylesterase